MPKTLTKKPVVQTTGTTHSFVYNDKKHSYRFDGDRMTGVTTILGVVNKEALKLWYAKQALERVWAGRDMLKTMTDSDLRACLLAAVSGADDIKDNSASIGKEAHKWCELHDKGLQTSDDLNLTELAENYLKWKAENVEKVLFVEKPLFSIKEFVAGTPDRGYLMKNGQNLIGDTKFTGGIYDRLYFAQMTAYRMMFEEMADMTDTSIRLEYEDHVEEYASVQEYLQSLGDVKWNGGVVIRQGTPVPDQSDKLFPKREVNFKNDFEIAYSFDYKGDLSIFLSALEIYRRNN